MKTPSKGSRRSAPPATHTYSECCTGHTTCGRPIRKGHTPMANDREVTCRACRRSLDGENA